jgi:sulfonate transport system ATP-binding protein
MHRLIESIWQRHRFTALLVTHDVAEAVALADRVILIDEQHIVLDEAVTLPRPRVRDAAFDAIESRVLKRVLRTPTAAAPAMAAASETAPSPWAT